MNAIEVKNLDVMIHGFSLKDIGFVVPAGSVVGLVGRNGAGKTTLMKSLVDGYVRKNGSILFYGEVLSDEREALLNSIGYIGDEFAYTLQFTISRCKKLYEKLYKNFQTEKFDAYCASIGIDQKTKLVSLSLGQKKLVELYLALSRQVKLLILDEPMANLDPVIRHKIIEELHTFMLEEDHAILISSHILSDLEKLVDYVAFIEKGELVLQDAMDHLMESYVIVHGTQEELMSIKDVCMSWLYERGEIRALCKKEDLLERGSYSMESADLEMILYHISEATL